MGGTGRWERQGGERKREADEREKGVGEREKGVAEDGGKGRKEQFRKGRSEIKWGNGRRGERRVGWKRGTAKRGKERWGERESAF